MTFSPDDRDLPCSRAIRHPEARTHHLKEADEGPKGIVLKWWNATRRPSPRLLTWYELPGTGRAAKAFYVIDFRFGAHHKVVFTERTSALITFGTE